MRLYDRQGKRITWDEYLQLRFADMNGDYFRVAEESYGNYWISTVWLGLDHGMLPRSGVPLIFETMVFAGDDGLGEATGLDYDCRRYGTEAEAIRGHKETVLMVRATYMSLADIVADETPVADSE